MLKKTISFLAGIFIFSVLPLIGWGINDTMTFVQNPCRLAFIGMMAVLSLFVVIFVPQQGKAYENSKKTLKGQKFTILCLQIIPLFIVIGSPLMEKQGIALFPDNNYIRISGLLLSFTGFLLMNWSVMVLGKQFSIDVSIQQNHKLIVNGPYKYIRHPRYLGIILFFSGIPLVFIALLPLILDILLVVVLLWRIKDEEKLMQDEFQAEWNSYKQKTHSLLPFIY